MEKIKMRTEGDSPCPHGQKKEKPVGEKMYTCSLDGRDCPILIPSSFMEIHAGACSKRRGQRDIKGK